jgi:hypothetical protein
MTIPSGRISNEPEERERRRRRREKMPFIVATYVYASSQLQRTHSTRTKIPLQPIKLSVWLFYFPKQVKVVAKKNPISNL